MRLYRLGMIPWQETQAIYHALAEAGQEALVLCRPASRYVCLGFHDDVQQEVDLSYCEENAIPLIRRETGGGMVLLDKDQLFFQLILHKDNPLLAGRRDAFFQKFLAPAVATLCDFGLAATIQQPADIVVNGRKISGNGAGDINGYAVYIGNILMDFDRQTMAKVLQTQSEAFRAYAKQSMAGYMTTMNEELGYLIPAEQVEEKLLVHFRQWLPSLVATKYSPQLRGAVEKVAERLMSAETLSLPGKKIRARQIKIKEGVYVRLHRYFDGYNSGSAIILIQDGIIRHFESINMGNVQQYDVLPLAPYINGIPWCDVSIREALQRWRAAHFDGLPNVDCELLLKWIIEGII